MFIMMTSTVTQIPLKNCDGGHYCSPPKECCKQGCCYLLAPSVSYRPPSLSHSNSALYPYLSGHWYFWAALTATVAGIVCACSFWRRHTERNHCCERSGRDDRVSEPDSNGSCYAPPHYSRCSSFHQGPPPYSEVTSKPDLYPLVISYNGFNADPQQKVSRSSEGYLMMQYFRNYIVRPIGTLSETSTMDSLGSSFICNVTNEANTIIPPPYSSAASLEGISVNSNNDENPTRSISSIPRSVSVVTNNAFHLAQHSPARSSHNASPPLNFHLNKEVSITSNPCYMQHTETLQELPNISGMSVTTCSTSSNVSDYEDSSPSTMLNPMLNLKHEAEKRHREYSNKFSDLLNLSVCIPSSITRLPVAITTSSTPHDLQQYSAVNSTTSSDVSSLANLSAPGSPPQATSPTEELRELLYKIHQLPHRKSPEHPQDTRGRNCFGRSKAKTLYMPLKETASNRLSFNGKSVLFGKTSKSWLSRSAPNTPCGNFMPSFPATKKHSDVPKNNKGKICDGRPLLNDNEESDEDLPRKHCL